MFKLLLLSTLLFVTSAFSRTWHINSKATYLELEVDTEFSVPLNEGETATLNGHFCLRTEKPQKCHLLTPEDLSRYDIKFFYPDVMTEVTDNVTLTLQDDRHDFNFQIPAIENLASPIFIAQVFNKGSKAPHLEKALAKFRALKEKLLEKKTHWPHKGKDKLAKFAATLKKIENRILLKLQGETSLIAKRNFPLQVKNNISKSSSWSHAAEEWQIEVNVGLGNSFEGEKTWMNFAFTPYVTNSFDWKFDLYLDNQLIKSFTATDPEATIQDKILSSVLTPGIHEIRVTAHQNDKKNGKNPKWERTFDKTYKFSNFTDQTVPEFSNITPAPGRYVSRDKHTLSYTAIDPVGRIDAQSIMANFQLQDGSTLNLTNDLNYQTNGHVLIPEVHGNQEGSSSYIVSGTFTNLPEGIHQLALKPADFAGNEAQGAEWTFIYDRTPPLALLPITETHTTNDESFELPFTVNDLTKTFIKIYVNGILQVEAEAADGSYSDSLAIDLVEGPNFIKLEAIDEAGNITSINYPAIILDTVAPELESLNLAEGDLIRTKEFLISGSASEELLSVLVNGDELDLPTISSSFAHIIEHIIDGPQRVEITLMDRAGNTNEYSFEYQFLLKLIDAELIAVVSLDDDHLDIIGYPGASQPNLEITAEDGLLNTGSTTAAEDGSFRITLDKFQYAKVTAFDSFRDRGESAVVSFTADTTLAGTVKDIYDNPLPGVTVTIVSSGQSTLTDTNGTFAIPSPALGDQIVTIDGRSIPEEITNGEKAYSVTTINVSLGNQQKNIIERPIYLAPKLLDGTETVVASGTATTVSSPHAPGVEISIPANIATFPGGAKSGTINVMEIPADKTSVEMLEMAKPDTVIALEPSGLEFSQRVDLTLPNVNEFPEGMELVILSKNSETGNWEVDGSANVVDSVIKTKPGEGISHFSEVFAAPLGMEVKAFKDGDKPSFDTMNGAVSTSVALPSFKAMGQDVSPNLVYNSMWADPNIVISNIFDFPRKYIEMSTSQSQGGLLGKAKVKLSIKQWARPEYIDAQFTASDVTSEKIRFTGIPDKSLVTYQADLGELSSGIHPAKSSYEVRFKQISLFTQKIKTKDWMGKTKTKTKRWRDEKLLEEIFPQELVSTIYHQNKKDSEFGAGWRLNLGKKILNPNQDRLMLEYENGQIGSYTLNNTVETVQYDEKGIRSFTLQGNDIVGVNMEGQVIRTSNGSTTVERYLPTYQGEVGINTSWYDHRTSKCVKSGYSGCRKRERTYYYNCRKYEVDFNHHRQVKSMFFDNGNLIYLDQIGAVWGNHDQFPISGEMAVPSFYSIANNATSEQSYQAHCTKMTGANCSGVRENQNIYQIRVRKGSRNKLGWCNNSGLFYSGNGTTQWRGSEGFAPQVGSTDGLSTISRFNRPKSMVKGFRPESYLVADYGNNTIRMVDLISGNTSTIAGNKKTVDSGNGGQALAASIYHPRGLLVLPDGSYLISSENGYIRRVTSDGIINAYIGKPTSKGGILTDITDMEEVALSSPSGMVYDEENDYLYVADTGHNRILRIHLESEEARVVAGNGTCATDDTLDGKAALDVALCRPEQIGLDSNNNLLVLDEPNKRVRRINFYAPEDGLIRYQPLAKDNTQLLRNQDGMFILQMRDGTETLFSANGLELETIDRVGRSTKFTYDGNDRLIKATLPTGQSINLTYSGHLLSQITDAAGKTTQFNYSNGHLTNITYPDGTDKVFDYNGRGILVAERNQRGLETQYILNKWGRLNKIKRPDGTSITVEDAASKTIANENVNGNSSELKSLTSDQNDLKDLIADAKGNTTTFLRDTNGYVQEIEDATGLITKIERDSEGRPTKIIKPDLTYTEMTYDPATGDLLKRFESDSNLSELYTYNQFGQLTSYTDPLSNKKINTYDPATGLLLQETDPNGNFVQNSYNSLGLILASTNKLGLSTTYTYNSEGNVIEITAPMGEKSIFSRDNAGNVISKTNAKLQTTSYTFDAFNRLTSVTTPGNFTTGYTYLPTGELSLITNPEGFQTIFEYDDLGRLKKKISPKGQVTQLFYDNNDNVIKEITPKGDQKTFIYDEKNQLTQKILPDDNYNFVYNDNGDLTSTSNNSSSFAMTYVKILGENYLKTVTANVLDLPEQSTTYGYNAAGKRTHMSTNYLALTYSYDSAYRMTGVSNNSGQSFTFGYDEANRLTQINRPNDMTSTLQFDNNSFLTNFIHKKGSQIIESFIYTRDQIGNRTSIQTTRGSFSYGYDDENQLISASHPEADELHALETFTYDSLGNRLSDNQGAFNYDDKKFRLDEDYKYLYVYDLNGNLTSKQEKGMSGKVWNYVYNSENQMTEAHYFEGPSKLKSVSFFYDALGRRVKKAVEDFQAGNTYARKYAYDSNEIIAELDEDNNVLATYTHSGLRTDDVLSAEITSSGVAKGLAQVAGTYMYLKDGLGSVQAITTESGQLVQRYIYSSFGKLLKIVDAIGMETTAIKTAFTYTNREIDEETGLYFYRARYYDAHSGRFMQEDPHPGLISTPTTLSRYTYVLSNPMNHKDPEGKILTALAIIATTAIIAATVTTSINLISTGKWDWELFKDAAIITAAVTASGMAGTFAAGAFISGAGLTGAGAVFGGAIVGAAAGALTGGTIMGISNQIQGRNFQEGFTTGAWIGGVAGGFSGMGVGFLSAVDGSQGSFYTGQIGFGMMTMNPKLLTIQTLPIDSETKESSRDILYGSILWGGVYGGF